MARKALDAGVVPHTLGADMHGYNTFVPPPPGTPDAHPDDENHPFAGQARFSLTQAMSSMLALGLTLQQVVPMVTSNAAIMAGLPNQIGALKPGMEADVSVLDDVRGRFKLQDNERTEVIAERLLQPAFCLRAGYRFEATAPILPRAVAA
jgi:dihydroorotase